MKNIKKRVVKIERGNHLKEIIKDVQQKIKQKNEKKEHTKQADEELQRIGQRPAQSTSIEADTFPIMFQFRFLLTIGTVQFLIGADDIAVLPPHLAEWSSCFPGWGWGRIAVVICASSCSYLMQCLLSV